jgi:hypothetical protein
MCDEEPESKRVSHQEATDDTTTYANPPKVLRVKDPPYLKHKPLHPHLPQPPALVLLCSPIKTGKSTLVSNLLLNSHFYGQDYFDQTYIISNTIHADDTSRFLKQAYDCHDHYDDSLIEEIVHRQNQFEKKDMPEIAIVLDDVLGSIKNGAYVNKLSTRFRHYNIKLLLFSTQVFRSVSNIIRQNCTSLIVGSPFANKSELLKIAEEYGEMFGGPEQFLHIYRLATPERYDFMYCDLQSNPPLAYHCFEHLVAEGANILTKGSTQSSDDDSSDDDSTEPSLVRSPKTK